MTNEEAIYKLEVFRDNGRVLLDPCLVDKDRLWKGMTEVFNKAIEALGGKDTNIPSSCPGEPNKPEIVSNIQRHQSCKNRTTLGNCDPVGGFCGSVPRDICEKHHAPSARPELIRINLNEPIKVKLTDWGKELYYHQYDRTNQIVGRKICEPKFPKEDENGYTEFQLWCFIELYGEHIGMTLPNVIKPLEIVYER